MILGPEVTCRAMRKLWAWLLLPVEPIEDRPGSVTTDPSSSSRRAFGSSAARSRRPRHPQAQCFCAQRLAGRPTRSLRRRGRLPIHWRLSSARRRMQGRTARCKERRPPMQVASVASPPRGGSATSRPAGSRRPDARHVWGELLADHGRRSGDRSAGCFAAWHLAGRLDPRHASPRRRSRRPPG